MDALQTLFSQYSTESLIIFVVLVLVAFKFISELVEYAYNKVRGYFKKKDNEDEQQEEIFDKFKETNSKIDNVVTAIESLNQRIAGVEEQEKLTQERLQENTKSFLIDAHHRFCYQVGAIDDINLQSIERRYLYYKNAGGNSFIDTLMEEIRALPKVALSNKKVTKAKTESEEE